MSSSLHAAIVERSIAERFGMSQSQIGNIVRGNCWKDGPWP